MLFLSLGQKKHAISVFSSLPTNSAATTSDSLPVERLKVLIIKCMLGISDLLYHCVGDPCPNPFGADEILTVQRSSDAESGNHSDARDFLIEQSHLRSLSPNHCNMERVRVMEGAMKNSLPRPPFIFPTQLKQRPSTIIHFGHKYHVTVSQPANRVLQLGGDFRIRNRHQAHETIVCRCYGGSTSSCCFPPLSLCNHLQTWGHSSSLMDSQLW